MFGLTAAGQCTHRSALFVWYIALTAQNSALAVLCWCRPVHCSPRTSSLYERGCCSAAHCNLYCSGLQGTAVQHVYPNNQIQVQEAVARNQTGLHCLALVLKSLQHTLRQQQNLLHNISLPATNKRNRDAVKVHVYLHICRLEIQLLISCPSPLFYYIFYFSLKVL